VQALEKLSHEHPQAVLRQGGLVAVLSYLDFFQTGVQRVAVATAATMCRSLTTDNIDAVSSAVPILTNLLQYQVRDRFHMHIYTYTHIQTKSPCARGQRIRILSMRFSPMCQFRWPCLYRKCIA
jgi:hypothetical protein